ncbi:HLA class II histocompatibility antigen, DR beta 4 chain-like isoform X2 [Scomber scombrus]|uniref:HLA class II histocompatibility antigen, DR beta 4 chain-like isoform X2 n=1 Tax=Scomber scombrus TaxID=13677 RepID=UPI002DD88628|nr:HLA class II histocompatibility antigen, DR beta 4 chain-like isoform X2 [Scomber scombrus]
MKMMGIYFLCTMAVAAVLLCTPPAGSYTYQMMYDCEYGNNNTDMVFFVKNVFNQKINTMYDSRVGKYVGFGEYGMKNADHYNSQGWKMFLRRAQVEILCRYNAQLFRRSTLDRKGGEGELAEGRRGGHHRCVVHRCHGQRGLELPASLVPGADTKERGAGDLQGGPRQPEEEPGGGLGHFSTGYQVPEEVSWDHLLLYWLRCSCCWRCLLQVETEV